MPLQAVHGATSTVALVKVNEGTEFLLKLTNAANVAVSERDTAKKHVYFVPHTYNNMI